MTEPEIVYTVNSALDEQTSIGNLARRSGREVAIGRAPGEVVNVLVGIHRLLSGALLAPLDAMGHGDVVVVADANFPARSLGVTVVDLVGTSAAEVLEAILTVLPLDEVEPLSFMAAPEGWLPVHQELLDVVVASGGPTRRVERLDRGRFYELGAAAQLVVRTGERRAYGNVAVRRGVLADPGGGRAEDR